MSLEFLQKSDFRIHTPPSSKRDRGEEEDSDRISESVDGGDADNDNEEVEICETRQQCKSCPQKDPSLTPASGGIRRYGGMGGGNFFSRTFAAALDPRVEKSHSRRSIGLPSFRRGDQCSSMRLRLLSSLRHHQQHQHLFQHQTSGLGGATEAVSSSSPSSSPNELTAKSLPQVTATSSAKGPSRRGACSSAGDARYLVRPSRGHTSVSSASVTQNGSAGGPITTVTPSGGSSPSAFSYRRPPQPLPPPMPPRPPHDSLV